MNPAADAKDIEPLLIALFEGELSAQQRCSLETLVKSSETARAMYLDYCEMHALLQWEHGVLGVSGKNTAAAPKQLPVRSRFQLRRLWLPLAAAAAIVAALLITFMSDRSAPGEVVAEIQSGEFVARLTGAKDCQFVGTPASFQTGSALQHGQRVEILSGFAEITFDSGAQVLLEGPAALDLNSAWDAVLVSGSLKASVPTEAIGFRIASSSVDVVDLGTEFSMVADETGATEVFVLKGSVQAGPVNGKNVGAGKVLLKEKEARRFAHTGMTEVADRERKAKRWATNVPLERFTGPTEYVHWSFDETAGKIFKAEAGARIGNGLDAHFKASEASSLHAEGRWNHALNLDGEEFARIAYPGISNNSARSVAFWIKVPADAPIVDGDTVLAWGRKERKRNVTRPVQIGWNNNAAHGTLGTLRTELGRSFVTGSTPLRDGKWHHVAITFLPGERLSDPVHVSQYVDGRLDGITSARLKDRHATEAADEAEDMVSEMLFLGSGSRPQQSKFHGELDELYIVERALTPQEIQQLMNENRLVSRTLTEN